MQGYHLQGLRDGPRHRRTTRIGSGRRRYWARRCWRSSHLLQLMLDGPRFSTGVMEHGVTQRLKAVSGVNNFRQRQHKFTTALGQVMESTRESPTAW